MQIINKKYVQINLNIVILQIKIENNEKTKRRQRCRQDAEEAKQTYLEKDLHVAVHSGKYT